MATEAARLKGKNHLVRKTDLTLTGLLMEGLGSDLGKFSYRGEIAESVFLHKPPNQSSRLVTRRT
jgi:hypothetical protein